ncbi:hypothetical protein [Stenotrophomonas maltophilia]|uniref:hypothetical protein n=1 Tax=Stenotrophomonas maltophilia TaxID=40324 RepID=UPI003BF8239E
MHSTIPHTINAGFNFSATAWHREFSGAEWVLQLNLRGPSRVDVEAVRDGARHVFSVPGAETATWLPGAYAFTVRATNGSDVHLIEQGTVRVAPDIAAAAAGHDGRSEARRALEAIEAVIAKRATVDQESYKINNRELVRMSVADLLRLRAHYVELVRREDAKAAGRSSWGRQVKFRMGPN